jgi:diguanylate cyclase (GGDEF)-like protein
MNSNILLVDANPLSRTRLAEALAQGGFSARAAADGAAALAQLTRVAAELIILDLRVAGVEGADLTDELRAVPGAAQVPILALAGALEPADEDRAGLERFSTILFRPIDISLLMKAVRAHLGTGGVAAPSGNDRPILVIDDDPIQVKLLALRLCQMGFAVLIAHDGESGLEQARAFHPAAILSDVLMPGIDGFQLCAQARADAALAKIPIVLVTNNPVRDADQRAAQRLGAGALVQSDADFRGATRALLAVLAKRADGNVRSPQLALKESAAEAGNQTGFNYDLARHCAAQSARLAVLDRVDETFLDGGLSSATLHRECLAQLVDATGLYCGAILARDDARRLSLSAHIGMSDATAKLLPGFFALNGPVDEAMKRTEALHIASQWSQGGAARSLMSAIGAETAWISPLRFGRDDLGLVLLFSPVPVPGSQWIDLAQSAVQEIARLSALSQKMNRLRSLASFDAMTGLPNHSYLDWQLQKFANMGKRGVLYLLKLERFQELHCLLGAKNSQTLLRQLAARVRGQLPADALVARMDYDGLAVLRADTADVESVERAARQLLESLAPAYKVGGLPITLRLTMGVACFADLNEGAEMIIGRADTARRRARETGRDYLIDQAITEQGGADCLALLSALRQAIGRNELALHYQPKVRLDSGATIGVEALLRWRHPEHGWIAPDRFIPLAEQAGLIYPITLWVAGSALAQARAWRAAGRRVEVAVNVSACDLRNPAFPDILAKLCQSKGAVNDDLTLEFSERSLSADPARAAAALARLNTFGFGLSLDDFGAGHCSLADLQALPIKELKIDRSFISSLGENPRSSAMVRSIIDLGRNLDVNVVAKGIESRESWDALDHLGCDMGQGFFICRPLPPSELATRNLAQWAPCAQTDIGNLPTGH